MLLFLGRQNDQTKGLHQAQISVMSTQTKIFMRIYINSFCPYPVALQHKDDETINKILCTALPINILRISNRPLAKATVQNPKDDLTSHTFDSLPSGDIDGPNAMFYIYQCFCHDSRTSQPGFHRVCFYIYPRRKIFS